MSWGASGLVTEFNASHDRVFSLDFGSTFSYRAFPVPAGQLSLTDVRAGMDQMYPR
jgi:hypothetical protein